MIKARMIQQERFKGEKGVYSNSQMNTHLLRNAQARYSGQAKLKDRMEKLNMSARAFDRILSVVLTVLVNYHNSRIIYWKIRSGREIFVN